MRVFISDDAVAKACGAENIAARFAEFGHEVVRTSSWGLHWLEPLVEIEVDGERVGYGPVTVADIEPILQEALSPSGERVGRGGVQPARDEPGRATLPLSPTLSPEGEREWRRIGNVASHPFLTRQTRLTFARAGRTRPLSLEDYAETNGWAGLERARSIGPNATVEEVTRSGLRGRGGAGFPCGIKWQTVAAAPGPAKYIVCNADEGDSGTFADRMLMEGDPYCLIEGMAIAGIATGAGKGYIYIRSEYPDAIAKMEAAIALSAAIVAPFEIEVRVGAGAYVCGEETSLLNSIEGKRGEVRAKPPLPAHQGLFGRPTAINNVLTLAAVPFILAEGGNAYAAFGMGRSRGTMPIQLAGNVKYGGLFEAAFGLTLGELVDDIGGGTASGRPVRAVQVGGPLGAYFPRDLFDTPFDYEAFADRDGLIGHGGIVVFDDSIDMAAQARFAMEFCAVESCGKCTPCRIGSVRGRETLDRIMSTHSARPEPVEGLSFTSEQNEKNRASTGSARTVEEELALIEDLCETMKFGSLCALGGFTPYPVLSAIRHFPEDFQ